MKTYRNVLLAVLTIALVPGTVWAGPTTDPLKWSQPPVVVGQTPDGKPLIYGWDEPSMVNFPIVADDYECKSPLPVTDIHWWGSYPLLQPGTAPVHPNAFLIRFWTDVPAGQDDNMPWSHPRDQEWEIWATNYQVESVGYDIDVHEFDETGIPMIVDEAFQYNYRFPIADWFWQQGTATDKKVYWVSIQAMYDDSDPDLVWGWKTRPHFWNDDAVVGSPNAAAPGGIRWDPIMDIDPLGNERSWDMAYELTTIPEPATLSLLGSGVLIAAFVLWRRRRR